MKLTKQILLVLTLSLIFSAVLFSSTVVVRADDDGIDPDPDEFDPETKKNAARVLTVENDGSTAKLTSILKFSEDKDEFSIQITTNDGLSFHGLYKSKTESNKINLEFQLRFYTIIEYVDTNGNGMYDDDLDSYIGEYDIDEFLPIEYSYDNAHILVVETTDGVFLARVYAVEGITDVNGIIVTPMQVKIDFEIHNYVFTEKESLLALLVHFQTNAAYGWNERSHAEEEGYEDDETEVEMKNRDATGYFSWANTVKADVDGDVNYEKEFAVLASSLKDSGNGKKIYLNYPHAANIIHDPKIGIVGGFPLFAFFAIGGAVMLVAIGTTVFIIRKKRRN